jgi:sensor histidine kinase YesM
MMRGVGGPVQCVCSETVGRRIPPFYCTPVAARARQGYRDRQPMNPTVRLSLIAAGAATVLAFVSASQTYLSMLNHGHSFVRMFTWQLGCWGLWALVAPWIMRVSGRITLARLLALGVALTVVQGLIAAQLTVWLRPYTPVSTYSFTQALQISWPFLAIVGPLVYSLLVVGGTALRAYERAKQLELRESQLEAEVTRAQLDVLSLEIQPHFLFNTLNSIAALIRLNDGKGALGMLLGLSDLMRSTLDRSAGQLAPLEQEVALVKRYVDIQRARFGDRLEVAYRIDETCERADVPTFLLQPLVENAMRHGLAPGTRTCHLEIGASSHNGSELRLWVTDDGAGLPAGFDLAQHAGTGLRNTTSRINRLYGRAATVSVRPHDPAGTTVELTFPRTRNAIAAGEDA